jgi:hypothetical protein
MVELEVFRLVSVIINDFIPMFRIMDNKLSHPFIISILFIYMVVIREFVIGDFKMILVVSVESLVFDFSA